VPLVGPNNVKALVGTLGDANLAGPQSLSCPGTLPTAAPLDTLLSSPDVMITPAALVRDAASPSLAEPTSVKV